MRLGSEMTTAEIEHMMSQTQANQCATLVYTVSPHTNTHTLSPSLSQLPSSIKVQRNQQTNNCCSVSWEYSDISVYVWLRPCSLGQLGILKWLCSAMTM